MYHIKHDKRSQKSAVSIYNALSDCLKTKSFYDITISDIQKRSSISRSTFYRHFDHLSDVLYWRCDQCFTEVLSHYQPSNTAVQGDTYHFVRYFLNYWFIHIDILELLLAINRFDIIYDCHMNHLENFFKEHPSFLPFPSDHYDYFTGIRSGIMIGVLMACLKNKKRQSVDEILDILRVQLELIRTSDLFV